MERFAIDLGRGMAVGVFIWMLIGVTISGATWHLYDIYWVVVAVCIVTAVLFAMLLIEALRERAAR